MVVSTLRDRSKTKRQKTSIVDEMSKKSTNLEFPLENDIQLEAHYVHTYIHCLRKRKKKSSYSVQSDFSWSTDACLCLTVINKELLHQVIDRRSEEKVSAANEKNLDRLHSSF